MADYKLMYINLFNHITDAIELLQSAQREAEECYIAEDEEPVLLSLEGSNPGEQLNRMLRAVEESRDSNGAEE